ncbi:hypothetical protein LO762_05350 [Actinocorallia sp. API 0066]|uniref:hypothetical protein n=1 Tax=Actinocorallia sp. API 0066 TaxID=2896846 RepID=UPI001E30998A|nr:hypothetical protein [Actinocorallia sp. API 0066]MCD0448623.1 hypothetical protein [Actinocorallia sp. API 0066]
MMRGILILVAASILVLPAPASAEQPVPTVTTAGPSFLSATVIVPGQPVVVPASTGDYLYWSFAAAAGEAHRVSVRVTLPPTADRHGPTTWTLDVFDGLRRRQPCTAGTQTGTAKADAADVTVGCSLRRVRSWADHWSHDALPGTYYLRLSATGLPERDLGLPVQANVELTVKEGAAHPAGARMEAPLSPPINAGATLPPDGAAPTDATTSAPKPLAQAESWVNRLTGRWTWTIVGGAVAALTGILGYTLTRHPRRRP